MKILKLAFQLLLFFICCIVVYISSYFVIEIYPDKDEIDEKIALYSDRSKNILTIKKMAIKEEGVHGIKNYVSHILALESSENSNFRGLWHVVGIHWHLWTYLLYTDDEIFSIWLAIVPFENGRGLNEASDFYFGSKIEKLNCYQLAQLVVMVRSPSMFRPNSERSKKRIEANHVTKSCDNS